jgi:hypothetical protein
MATQPTSIRGHIQPGQSVQLSSKPLIGGSAFDAYFLFAILWFESGTFLDAWAHNNIPHLETFFTPWHAVLYSGLIAAATMIFAPILINHRRGATWREAIPRGYELTVLGIGMMFVVGVGDMIWHVLFGVEQNIDALFSPTHLAAMVCIGLAFAGPLRAIYQRPHAPSTFGERLLLMLAVASLLVFVVNVSQSASLYVNLWPTTTPVGQDTGQLLAVLSFVFQAILFTGLSLYVLRRWPLPLGYATIVLTLIAIPLSSMQAHYIMIPISFIAGILVDMGYFFLKPSAQRPTQFRLYAIVAAATLYAVYMITLELTMSVVWTVHMAIGSVVVVGIAGWLLSYLVLPGKQ